MPAPNEDDGTLLERYRGYVAILARAQLEPALCARVDLSGVVQQTLIEAHQAIDQFREWGPGQRAAWLRRALANNLTDEVRKLTADKRDIDRELSLENDLTRSAARLEQWLVADQSSPSQRVEREEQSILLARALDSLPEAQREALVLQHWHAWPLARIAEHMGRTPVAVAGLLKRGLQRLREILAEPETPQ